MRKKKLECGAQKNSKFRNLKLRSNVKYNIKGDINIA